MTIAGTYETASFINDWFKKNYLFESKILEMQNYRHWLVSITIYSIRNKISRFFKQAEFKLQMQLFG